MKKNSFFILIFVFLLLPGCAWFSSTRVKGGGDTGMPVSLTPIVQTAVINNGKIIDGQRLKQGGKVLIVTFKPGVNVVANNELDSIALMMVKGMAETFMEKGVPYKIVGFDREKEADFIITGHVTEVSRSSKTSRWVLKKPWISLEVEGKVVEVASKKDIAVFTHKLRADPREKNYKQLGYDIGQDIGDFIISGAK